MEYNRWEKVSVGYTEWSREQSAGNAVLLAEPELPPAREVADRLIAGLNLGDRAVPNPDNDGVRIPTWLLAGFIGLIAGMVIGPSIMASTKSGSDKLAELSRKYIESK